MIDLDIIIPVYNETDKINKLLNLFIKKLKMNFRIVVCYDIDNDNTLNFINKIHDYKEKIVTIKNKKHGPNEAIKSGIKFSSSKVIVVYMADDFENIDLLNKMYEKIINDSYDIVIASRFINGGKFLGASRLKRIVTIFGSNLIYYLGRVPFKDATNAFKMFNKKTVNNIKIESSVGFTYAIELTIKAYKKKLKIIELPCIWIDVEGRKSKFKLFTPGAKYSYGGVPPEAIGEIEPV